MSLIEPVILYLNEANRRAEFTPHPDGFVPADIAALDEKFKESKRVRIHFNNNIDATVLRNKAGSRYQISLSTPQYEVHSTIGIPSGSYAIDPPARNLIRGISLELKQGQLRRWWDFEAHLITGLSREELRTALNALAKHPLIPKPSSSSTGIKADLHMASLGIAGGDTVGEQLEDIRAQAGRITRWTHGKWRQFWHPSLQDTPEPKRGPKRRWSLPSQIDPPGF